MLIDFRKVLELTEGPLKILHIGAGRKQNMGTYGDAKVTWVEANPDIPGVFHGCVSDQTGSDVVLNITNNEVSSSILTMGTHTSRYPHVKVQRTIPMKTITIRDLSPRSYNFLNLDIQGAEMLALKGAGSDICFFDYVYTRFYQEQTYIGAPTLEETDTFLGTFGFHRKITQISEYNWGDAFYVREKCGIIWFGTPHHGVRKSLHVLAEKTNVPFRQVSSVADADSIPGRQVILSFAGPFPNNHKGKVLVSGPNFHAVDYPGHNIVYNCLSSWNKKIIDHLPHYTTVAIQFPIDYDTIAPDPNIPRTKVIFYAKNRPPALIEKVLNVLVKKYGNDLIYFNYNSRYDYNHWLSTLKTAKFCVLLDGSESQGFAVQEIMSTNVPLVVFDCPSWTELYPYDRDIDKYRAYTQDFSSTSVTLWDEKCGIKTTLETFEQDLGKMEKDYLSYAPRDIILRELDCWKIIREYEKVYDEYGVK